MSQQQQQSQFGSEQQLYGINSVAYKVGETLGAASALLTVGAFAGVAGTIGLGIFGASIVLKNTINFLLNKRSEKALISSATDKILIKDLDKLFARKKVGDTEYRKTALFIDKINERVPIDSLGKQIGDRYRLFRAVDSATGVNTYKIVDIKTEEILTNFEIDRRETTRKLRQDAVRVLQTSYLDSDAHDRMMNFISETAAKCGLSLELPDPNAINYQDVAIEQSYLEQNLSTLNESLDRIEFEETISLDDKLERIDSLIAMKDLVTGLAIQSERLSSAIEQERKAISAERDRGLNPYLQENKIDILSGKLDNIAKSIGIIERKIKTSYDTLNGIEVANKVPVTNDVEAAADVAIANANMAGITVENIEDIVSSQDFMSDPTENPFAGELNPLQNLDTTSQLLVPSNINLASFISNPVPETPAINSSESIANEVGQEY
jgi:hypothetical protein